MKKLRFIYLLFLTLGCGAQTPPVVFDDPPTPVEFLDIKVSREGTSVSLIWRTASELNNDFFTIESSKDGVNWEVIGKVPGSGTTKMIQKYIFSCDNPYKSYYRIFQTDYDGTTEFVVLTIVQGLDKIFMRYYDQVGRELDPGSRRGLVIVYSDSSPIQKAYFK